MAGSQTAEPGLIRTDSLTTHEQFQQAVDLQRRIWGFAELELLPVRLFVVASKVGGLILGAYDGDQMIGFSLAIPGIKHEKSGNRGFLHSHMTGVLEEYNNRGVGRLLKLKQRELARERGIELIEWTFDPLELKNAFLNLGCLGAIARRYVQNQYGTTTSFLHGGLLTDRLVAEWWVGDDYVAGVIAGRPAGRPVVEASIPIPNDIAALRTDDPKRAREIQSTVGEQFRAYFDQGLVVVGFERTGQDGIYLLGPLEMRLERITLRLIRMPLVHFFETSFGRTTERAILLVEVAGEGASGWGEVTAGENPFYNEEWTESAWLILRDYVAPRLFGRDLQSAADVAPLAEHIRGHRMARGGLEVAVWDLEARLLGKPLWEHIGGGARTEIPCGVSIGIQDSVPQLLEKIEKEPAAGYQRIKMKIKPGWDVDVVAAVRDRFPGIRLMADANSAYTLADAAHLKLLDRFYLMMIEQPLAHDDIIDHAVLQAKLDTPICLDECIRSARHAEQAIRLHACRIINIKLGRVGGFLEAKRVHDVAQAAGIPVWCGGMLEAGIGRAHNIALATLPNFSLPGDVSASQRYWSRDIIQPPVETTAYGTIAVRPEPGFGYPLDREFLQQITVREETLTP